MEGNDFTLIWANKKDDGTYDIMNPKNLMCMNLDKAIGSIAWTKRVFSKSYTCFIYDPSVVSIFNKDGSQNIEVIENLIKTAEEFALQKETAEVKV